MSQLPLFPEADRPRSQKTVLDLASLTAIYAEFAPKARKRKHDAEVKIRRDAAGARSEPRPGGV